MVTRSVDPRPQPVRTTWNGRPRTPPAPSATSCCRCVEAAIKAGATTINLPDTVGYTYPDEYADLFRDMIANVPTAPTG